MLERTDQSRGLVSELRLTPGTQFKVKVEIKYHF
jgi:hypothetical protein